jgi:YfiH family protein
VHAVFTTRAGGHSSAPYHALNLGDHVGDDPVWVAANRATLRQAIPAKPVFLSQVHGTNAREITHDTPDGAQADGCFTSQPQLACTILVADCLPVLLTHKDGKRVAAAHAGWRSLVGQGGRGILENIYASFMPLAPASIAKEAPEIIAWLGPCIGPSAFEVGGEVRDAFLAFDPLAETMFVPKPNGKWLANLQGLARRRLTAMGISDIYGNDGSPPWCTVSQPSRFFSYRRDGVCGRMAACIWLD